jgi:hypothetical protein
MSPRGVCRLNRVLAPEGEVLSCSDKKVPKETLPRVPCTDAPMPRVQGCTGAACGRTPRGFLRCAILLRLKPGACPPWQARSPGRAFTGRSPFPGSPLARALDSGGPPKGHPCPCGGRARSLSCPFGPAPRLHSGLGLTKGAKNNVNFTPTRAGKLPRRLARRKAPKKYQHKTPLFVCTRGSA